MNTATITTEIPTTRELLLAQARAGHMAPRTMAPAVVRAINIARDRLKAATCDRDVAHAEGTGEGVVVALRETGQINAVQAATTSAELRTLGQRKRDELRHARAVAGRAA